MELGERCSRPNFGEENRGQLLPIAHTDTDKIIK